MSKKTINPISFMEMVAIEAKKFSDLINVHRWNRRLLLNQGRVMQYMYDQWIGSEREVSTERYHLGMNAISSIERIISDLFNSCRWYMCGLNSTWSVEAWCYTFKIDEVETKDGLFYVIDHEDGTYEVVRRWLSREENEVEHIKGPFDNRYRAKLWLEENYEQVLDERKQSKQPNKGE